MTNSIVSQAQDSRAQMLQQFRQFKNNFRGDPRQAVMNMLAQGQINNEQLQRVMQMARQMQGILK